MGKQTISPRFTTTTGAVRRFSALLTLLVAVTVLPPPSRADEDERPDLQIEVVGLQPGSRRDVLVRVTNISDWWSDRTVATVVTMLPVRGQERTYQIPDLNTREEAPLPHVFEFTYTLAADCNGHVVRASVSAGANYEGAKETGNLLDNNEDESDNLCAGVTPASVKPEGAKPETGAAACIPVSPSALILHQNEERRTYIAFARTLRIQVRRAGPVEQAAADRYLRELLLDLRGQWSVERRQGCATKFDFPNFTPAAGASDEEMDEEEMEDEKLLNPE
jgi:hypothetical protein